jgi:hypothetical protein
MKPHETLSPGKISDIPDEMERARYWADLLYKVVDKRDIYDFAKSNLDCNNQNAIKKNRRKRYLKKRSRDTKKFTVLDLDCINPRETPRRI